MLEKLNSRWNSAAGLHQLAIQYKAILRLGALTKCLFPQSCCCRIAKFQILEILGKLPRLLFNRCARCNLSNFQDTFDNFYIPANFNNFLFWQFWQCPEVLKKILDIKISWKKIWISKTQVSQSIHEISRNCWQCCECTAQWGGWKMVQK